MRAIVVSNSCIKGPYYKLILKPPSVLNARPGQFLMIRQEGYSTCTDPLLPRPFSIHRLTQDGHVEILYKVIGKGTTLLSHTLSGDEMEILGPLGNGFPIESGKSAAGILIVAGGIGVAPMVGLAEVLRSSYPEAEIIVFLGGRSGVDLLCVEELKKVTTEVILTTNDGTVGMEGYVTEALERYLHIRERQPGQSGKTSGSRIRSILYACGPSPMLQRILEVTRPLNMESYFSLEATMACGIGICMGCAVKRKDGGYYLVCKDGPVFKGDILEYNET